MVRNRGREAHRDSERQAETQTDRDALPKCFVYHLSHKDRAAPCVSATAPKKELGVLETCRWTETLPRERRSDRGRMPGSVESLSTWKAVSRFRTYKRASEPEGHRGTSQAMMVGGR